MPCGYVLTGSCTIHNILSWHLLHNIRFCVTIWSRQSEKPTPSRQANGLTSQNGYARLCGRSLCLCRQEHYTRILCKSQETNLFLQMGNGLPLCQKYMTGGFSMSRTSTTTSTKRRFTPEQLAHRAEYQRRYRREHPEASRRWWRSYVLRKAARLQAEAEAEGGADRGRD